jgi:hypothetical protein
MKFVHGSRGRNTAISVMRLYFWTFHDTLSVYMEFTRTCEENGRTATSEVLATKAIITTTIPFQHRLFSLMSYFIL